MPLVTYPGVTGVTQLDLTTSVGVSPAVIELVAHPDSAPDPTGTLVIGDGVNPPLTFPDCLCVGPRQTVSAAAAETVVALQDRRWRWRYGFPVAGHYNQEAGSGKLVPWSVRSPFQLASLLLAAMGELVDPAGQIDLPPGLAHPDLPKAAGDRFVSAGGQYLGLGQNYGLTQANPETRWAYRPAALCLADLADAYGRLVVLDPLTNVVSLRRPGVGPPIPAGARLRAGTVTQRDAVPTAVIARGSPTEYQLRLRLRAVAREADRSWRPVNEVSYAPLVFAQDMRCLVYGAGPFDPAPVYAAVVNGVPFATAPAAGASYADIATLLAAAINASADPQVAGQVTATADAAGRLQIDAAEDGSEFELTTVGTTAAAGAWTAACVRGPIRGERPRQNAWLVEWPDPQPAGTVLGLTVTAGGAAVGLQAVAAGDLNGLADATDRLAAQVVGVNATAVGGGRRLTVTGTVLGAAVSVVASSSAGAAPTVTQAATVLAPATGWERCPAPPFGVFARATAELNYEEAKRLANETVFTCYQVVCEDPATGAVKAIPVPELGAVTNPFLLLLQPDSPTPVTPDPGLAEVVDLRTLQPYAATTYDGYAVRRPNRVYGSVARHLLARDGLLWRGGTYLTHNTAPRSRLPLPFTVVDPEQQVVQFAQPLYRWLGVAAGTLGGAAVGAGPTWFTAQPAELVAEVGALCLDAATLAPVTPAASVAVPGGFGPPAARVFPDVRREVIGTYDARHALTGFTLLDQDAAARAAAYAQGVADTFQSPAGESVEYDGLQPVALSGLVRQVKWSVRPGPPGATTAVDTNCETSRVVLPYPQRRKAEGLAADQLRRQQNLDSDFLARARHRNALGAAAGGGLPLGDR